MSEPDPKERRRAQVRESVAKHKERLSRMTPLERLAYKHRASLNGTEEPYTQPERERVDALRERLDSLVREAEELHAEILGRLKRDGVDLLAAALETEGETRLSLKPF